jgi:hypothetical protein
MIEAILPARAAAAEAFGDEFSEAPLCDAEEAVVAGAVPGRRRECAAVRARAGEL